MYDETTLYLLLGFSNVGQRDIELGAGGSIFTDLNSFSSAMPH